MSVKALIYLFNILADRNTMVLRRSFLRLNGVPCDVHYCGVVTHSGNTWLRILHPIPKHWQLLGTP